jgi:hypothetical protein
MASYITVQGCTPTNCTFYNDLIAYTDPNFGTYLSSPSGVYTAFVTPGPVQLQVARGSTPPGSPNNVVWAQPSTPIAQDPSNTARAVLFPNGALTVANNPYGYSSYTVSAGGGNVNLGATLALNDQGTLSIYQGQGTQGTQLWSNGISDPVTAITLSSINYDLSNPTITTTNQVAGGTFTQTNNTATTQQYPVSLGLSYTKTSSWSWNLSESLSLGLKSTTSVGIPGVGTEAAEFNLTETTTLSGGQGGSDSESKTFTSGGNITVPAFSTYGTTLTGITYTYDIPYTWTGVATYSTGATADVQGTGAFNGADTGLFTTVTNCISQPGGCPTPPGSPGPHVPVPEPATLPLLPLAMMATILIRRLRPRRGGRAGPGGMGLRRPRGPGYPAG